MPVAPENQRVLIVDDEPFNLRTASFYLKDYGLDLLLSRDGREGVVIARRELPDLILLDIRMPGQDGFETCRQLKGDPATAVIPVVFFSALTEVEEKAQGFQLGAVDYITKPVQQQELVARVTTHLNQHRMHQNLS